MYSAEEKAKIKARGAHAIAQRNVVMAMSRGGCQPPPTAQPVAAVPAAGPSVAARSPEEINASINAEAARVKAEATAKAAAQEGWRRAMATATGKPLPSPQSAANGWVEVMAGLNGQTG